MDSKLNMLIVEDDEAIIKQWKEHIEFFNADEEHLFGIHANYSSNLKDAIELLKQNDFDVISVDMRLEGDVGNTDGNKVVEFATEGSMAVVAISTAEPRWVDIPADQRDFIEVFTKGGGVATLVLDWIIRKYSLIETVRHIKHSFKNEMAKLFSKSVWPRWQQHWERSGEDIFIRHALKRHMATHIQTAFMEVNEQGVHPEEYYFIPPINQHLNTGDIVFFNRKFQVIVTPRCDMKNLRINSPTMNGTYQLIQMEDCRDKWEPLQLKLETLLNDQEPKQSKIDAARKNLKDFTNHNGSLKKHFLQAFTLKTNDEYGPFHAVFNNLVSMEANEENRKHLLSARVASMAGDFVPSLVERLGNYFSRIGTPDYSHPT